MKWEYAVQILGGRKVLWTVTTISGSREAALNTLQRVREEQARAHSGRTARLVRNRIKWEVCK